MKLPSRPLIAVLALAALATALAPVDALAQKGRRAAQGPDADGDGVPDAADRCPSTPSNTRVNRLGCQVVLLRPGQQPPAQAAPPPGPAGAVAPQQAARGNQPSAAAPQSVNPAGAAAPGANPAASNTAGLAIPPFDGTDPDAYVRRFARGFDTVVVALVAVFRNTSGQPSGATEPAALSQRERDRWARCRDIHWDLTTYVAAWETINGEGFSDADAFENAQVQRAMTALDSALRAVAATAECDNVASMIAAPDRWTPWGGEYSSAARNFYRDWYGQVRDAHDRYRAFLIAVNGATPAAQRLTVPPGMPRTPPYAGAAPR